MGCDAQLAAQLNNKHFLR